MRVSAKVEYGVRACLVLARAPIGKALSAEAIATEAALPGKFLEAILNELRIHRIITTQRGPVGGARLARSPDEITVADIIRAVEGPLADVRGERPEKIVYPLADQALAKLWVAGRAAMRTVYETTTLAHLAAGVLPPEAAVYLDAPGAWVTR